MKVEGSFGFQLGLFPTSSHQPYSYLSTCTGARKKQNQAGAAQKPCWNRQLPLCWEPCLGWQL